MAEAIDGVHLFDADVSQISLPSRFTYPFNYDPHPLAVLACEELKNKYLHTNYFKQSFGLQGEGMGKMFGVLVVQTQDLKLGYLASFSGKIGDHNKITGFVPPVFDILELDGFFKKGEEEIVAINQKINAIEQNSDYTDLTQKLSNVKNELEINVTLNKNQVKQDKQKRKEQRDEINKKDIPQEEKDIMLHVIDKESADQHYAIKDHHKKLKHQIETILISLKPMQESISEYKAIRKDLSRKLQNKIFDAFEFINAQGERSTIRHIFHTDTEGIPPSGAGECCAPKLLQHAYLHQLRPIALAEFWWGKTPNSEIRHHENFYPVCKGKCEPILSHMLKGLDLDADPIDEMKKNIALDIRYEDDHIMVINKEAGVLSVPGKKIEASIYNAVKEALPDATGPLNVHRLDMSTSGILLIAKNMEAYHDLQAQFTHRKVSKSYIAVLDGIVIEDEGWIDLPLRVDLDDRPRQLVCYDYGKPARTKYRVITRDHKTTRVEFIPITGRTHQLRVHAAHKLGLQCPIKGDELYGRRDERLYLHAQRLEFRHPTTKEWMKIVVEPDF